MRIVRISVTVVLMLIILSAVAWAGQENCTMCHADKSEGKSVHPAVSKGCKVCHIGVDASNIPHKFFGTSKGLPSDGAKLCFRCHEERGISGRKKGVHAPVASGMCTTCHDPHASQSSKLLVSENICFNCHDSGAFTAKVSIHAPVAMGMCSSCHEPHQAVQKNLLKVSVSRLCDSCHDSRSHSEANHVPVRLGMCASCHEPHQSDHIKLTKASKTDLCLSCHEKAELPADRAVQGQKQALKGVWMVDQSMVAHF